MDTDIKLISTTGCDPVALRARLSEVVKRVKREDFMGLTRPDPNDITKGLNQVHKILRFITSPKDAREDLRKQYEGYLASWTPEDLLFALTQLATDLTIHAAMGKVKVEIEGEEKDESES